MTFDGTHVIVCDDEEDLRKTAGEYLSRKGCVVTLAASADELRKSIFILRYFDDLELRQTIEKQFNKVELANRFTRAVAVGNPREFIHAEKEQQEIAEACNRLIKNCIICWNYLYLARSIAEAKSDEACRWLLQTIASHSPIAWSHINLLGEYDLSDEKLQDSVGILSPKLPPSPNCYGSCRGGLRSFMQEHPALVASHARSIDEIFSRCS